MNTNLKPEQILNGHTSFETAYEVGDYPYGFTLRTKIRYWVESRKKYGDRFVSCTLNPKTGKWNKPKAGGYSPFVYMYLNEIGHVKHDVIQCYEREKFPEEIKFLADVVQQMNDAQEFNLRSNYYSQWRGSAPYIAVKYSDERKPEFAEWLKGLLKNIATAPITEIFNYPPPPEQDNPEEEVKFTSTSYKIGE